MSLYSIYPDIKSYMYIAYDWKQIKEQMGDEYRFDMDRTVKPYFPVWKKPVKIEFANEGMKGSKIPDISVDQGRLFLSEKAHKALKDVIGNDGEFLPVEHERGKGYMFNPLRLAEEVDGVDNKLSVKNEWGDVEHVAFDEENVKDFSIFKTAFDSYFSVYCQQSVKDAIEHAGLKGVVLTTDLGNYLGVSENMKN